MTKRCDTCQFWVGGTPGTRKLESPDPDDQSGTCHRYAPQPSTGEWHREILKMLVIIAWEAASDEAQERDFTTWEEATLGWTDWPGTMAVDWCGEWRAKAAEPVTGS